MAQQELLAQSFRTTPAGNALVVNGEPRENLGVRSQRRDVVHKKQVPRPLPGKASNDRILVDVWCQVRHALREQGEKNCQNDDMQCVLTTQAGRNSRNVQRRRVASYSPRPVTSRRPSPPYI